MLRRTTRALFPLALLVALVVAIGFSVGESEADLENQVFTSRADQLRIVVPRGWRATDQQSYPGLLLWMLRSQPEGRIALTAETFTHELYCSWPVACRVNHDSLSAKYACALRQKLADQHMKVGPTQAGPKENDAAGLPSVWFEYDDGKHFLRQAVALSTDRAVSLVLGTSSSEARLSLVRSFEQALRSLQRLGPASAPAPDQPASSAPDTDAAGSDHGDASMAAPDAITVALTSDGGSRDAGPSDADIAIDASADAGTTFESAPVPKVSPIRPCP